MSGSRSFLRLWFSFVLLGLVWLIWPTAVGASSISAPDRVALPPGLADVASRSSHEGGILRAQSPFASAFNGPTAFAYDAASETAPSRILDPERSSAIAVGLQGGAVHLVGSAGYLYDSTADFVAPSGTGGIGPVPVGQAGEAAVHAAYDIGPKATVSINGRTRILDGLTDRAVTEVKNVRSLSLTTQIRDNIDYAAQTGRRLDLYVRPDTHLSGPLLEAISGSNGAIRLRFIPQ